MSTLTTSFIDDLESFAFESQSDGFGDGIGLVDDFDVFDLAPSFDIIVLLNTCISIADGDSVLIKVVLSTDVNVVVLCESVVGAPLESLVLRPVR